MMHSTAYLEHYADKYMANMLYKHGVSLDQYLADPARYEHLLGAPFPLLPAQTRVRVRLIREDVLQQQAEEIAQALDNLPRNNVRPFEPLRSTAQLAPRLQCHHLAHLLKQLR